MAPATTLPHRDAPSQRRNDQRRVTKVAIIGTGLAGLCAAHQLAASTSSQSIDVHLFERSSTLGLDAGSITHNGVRIDVPMRSVNAGYYPNLLRLYRRLGVKLRRSNFTFSFASLGSARQPYLLYNGQNGLRGFSMPFSRSEDGRPSTKVSWLSPRGFIQTIHLLQAILLIVTSYLCLIVMALYHHACGHLLDPHHSLNHESLRQWAQRHSRLLHPVFVDDILFCLFSAVATSSYAAVESIPAAQVLLYIASTFLRDHYTVDGGVTTVQSALMRNVRAENVHLDCSVERIEYNGGRGATLVVQHSNGGDDAQRPSEYLDFDHVILATPATLSSSLLQSYADSLHSTKGTVADAERLDGLRSMQNRLSQIRYESSTVICHTDTALLPVDRRQWRDLNLVASPSASMSMSRFDEDDNRAMRVAMATHIIRQPRRKARRGTGTDDGESDHSSLVLQTTNPIVWPSTNSVISTSTFTRAMTPVNGTTIHSGLFAWRAERTSSLVQQTAAALLGTTSSKVRERSQLLHGDWLTTTFEALRGRRWTMSLGDLQRDQPSTPAQPCVWVCGSYAQGIPLLEGCVTSSSLVAEEIVRRTRASS